MAMYIINGTVFEGKWENVYNKEDLKNELFMTRLGKKKQVKMMHSEENKYISDKDTIGFIKNYSGGDYAFVALLPNKEMDIKAYVKSLNSKKLNKLLSKTETKAVHAALPAFKYDYKLEVEDVFKKMGMKDAFDSSKADFTGIGNRKNGFNISISGILHKTHITVDELGTKKGAITSGRHKDNKKTDRKRKEVILNRPFVYIVMDTKTNIPVFMGTVMDIGK